MSIDKDQAAHVNSFGALRQYTQDSKAQIDTYCLSLTNPLEHKLGVNRTPP